MTVSNCGFVQSPEPGKWIALIGFLLNRTWPAPGPFQSPFEFPNNAIGRLKSQTALKTFNEFSVIATQHSASSFIPGSPCHFYMDLSGRQTDFLFVIYRSFEEMDGTFCCNPENYKDNKAVYRKQQPLVAFKESSLVHDTGP